MKHFLQPVLLLAVLVAAAGAIAAEPPISGRLVDGLRQIEVDAAAGSLDLHVYRGDYVQLLPAAAGALLEVAELDIHASVPLSGEKPYLKFSRAGAFALTLDRRQGTITVHEFRRANYSELRSREAAALIESVDPLVLDVRTPREYGRGHLAGSTLLPVQILQRELGRLAEHRERPILIYCATGNRSTVAAKLLLDSGFQRVYNLRHGIAEWSRVGLSITR